MNKPITKEEMQEFKGNKHARVLITGQFPSRRMRRAYIQASNNPLRINNRKVTEGRKERFNFIRQITNFIKAKFNK